jgi:hypothetical protein
MQFHKIDEINILSKLMYTLQTCIIPMSNVTYVTEWMNK